MALGRITHRKPDFTFDEEFEKHWLGGSAFKTHFLNSLTLIFPAGEKYFIRSVKNVLSRVKTKKLTSEAKQFIKQEIQHSIEHEKFFSVLEKQGYEIRPLLKVIDNLVSKKLEVFFAKESNISITAGLEHITALLAEISLEENFLKEAPQKIQDLFNWHAAEEIEHRSVAFDVLNDVDPRYEQRLIGIIIAYIAMSTFAGVCTINLLHQDKMLFKKKTFQDFTSMFFTDEKLFFKAISIFFRYLDPDFHPDKSDVDGLTKDIFNKFQSLKVA
ncbi:MAG: metal-dependent hydrolase [Bacteriovoracaceae bacterium]|nr:metal-dependent hydrolase [Bacteriovoracaceae bacterium]